MLIIFIQLSKLPLVSVYCYIKINTTTLNHAECIDEICTRLANIFRYNE